MPIDVKSHGLNNKLTADDEFLAQGEGSIVFNGDNNVVHVAPGCSGGAINFTLGSNSTVEIGPKCFLRSLSIHTAQRGVVKIGDETGIGGLVRLLLHEPGRIEVGKRCLFAGGTDLSVSDMHSIVDASTGARLNPAQDIRLGDRVWVGVDAMILKGVTVGRECVIGARSIVTNDIPQNTVAAGNPARVVRTNVSWDFNLL